MVVHAAKVLSLEIDMEDVQRLASGGGGESLNVKPQVYGGRKIQVPMGLRNSLYTHRKMVTRNWPRITELRP